MTSTHKTLFLTIACALLGACGSIICGGCDLIEPGECLGEGELFGPCFETGTCSDGLKCFDATKGWICLPEAAAGDAWETSVCAAWRGDLGCSEDQNICFLACAGPDGCEGGTVCDEVAGMCVYPAKKSPPGEGEMFGPCWSGECGEGLTCLARAHGGIDGDICLPSCDVCEDPDSIKESFIIGPMVPACIDGGLCATPCTNQNDCNGDAVCMEGVCFRTDLWQESF
jgi:hypothetical protein